jgi:hypothetical protein
MLCHCCVGFHITINGVDWLSFHVCTASPCFLLPCKIVMQLRAEDWSQIGRKTGPHYTRGASEKYFNKVIRLWSVEAIHNVFCNQDE